MAKKSSALATKTDIKNLENLIKNMASKSDVEDMATKSDLENVLTKSDLENMATKSDIKNMASKSDIKNMATKADIANMATKSDLENMATKSDIKNMATKSDLENMATKSDLDRLEKYLENLLERRLRHHSVEIMSHVDVRFEEWRHDFLAPLELLMDHGKRIRRLETKVGIA